MSSEPPRKLLDAEVANPTYTTVSWACTEGELSWARDTWPCEDNHTASQKNSPTTCEDLTFYLHTEACWYSRRVCIFVVCKPFFYNHTRQAIS